MDKIKLDKLANNETINNNKDKLKELFPICFKDGDIDFEMLKLELGINKELNSNQMYGLNWFNKQDAINCANQSTSDTLGL